MGEDSRGAAGSDSPRRTSPGGSLFKWPQRSLFWLPFPVEEGELLRPVRRVVGRVQIDRDPPRPPLPALPVPLDDALGQLPCHPVQGAPAHTVLESRQRRLRRQALAGDRVPPQQQLVDGIFGEVVGIVPVRMAARDAEDPLADQVFERVPYLLRRTLVDQTPGEPLDEVVHPLGCLEQHAPPSELACSRSNVATTGLPTSSGNRTRCGIVGFVTQGPPLCQKRLLPTVF